MHELRSQYVFSCRIAGTSEDQFKLAILHSILNWVWYSRLGPYLYLNSLKTFKQLLILNVRTIKPDYFKSGAQSFVVLKHGSLVLFVETSLIPHAYDGCASLRLEL